MPSGLWHLARDSAPRIVTALDPETQAILVRNPWNTEFGGRVAFLDLGGRQTTWNGRSDRIPRRNGATDRPAGLAADTAEGSSRRRHGSVCRPADQLRACEWSADPGPRSARRGRRGKAAADLIRRGRTADPEALLREVASYWDDVQGTVQVRTPDRSMDIMLNRWLIYQTLACRLWRERRSTRQAVPTASATSSRTSSR